MRALALSFALLAPAFGGAANPVVCHDRCEGMVKVCEDQCTQRFPKGKQTECRHACAGAAPKCQERCKGGDK
jgi:hypothetical protein